MPTVHPSGHVYRHEGRPGPVWRALYRLPDRRWAHRTNRAWGSPICPREDYLRADEDAIHCNEPADVVVGRIEAGNEARFIQVTLAPYGKADPPRTA